ncbi:hypothetical protein Tco_1571418 [Tanacetum coccineum]
MAPEFWCQTNATEFWCYSISGAKLSFADVAPLFKFGTTTPSALTDPNEAIHKERMAALSRAVYATKYVKHDNIPAQIEESLIQCSADVETLLK